MNRLRRHQVFQGCGYPVAGNTVDLDGPVETHTHDFLEVSVVLSGTVVHLSSAGPKLLVAGSVTAVRPGEWHGFARPDATVLGNLYLGEELLHTELRWLLDVADLGRFLLLGGSSVDCLAESERLSIQDRLGELAGVNARPGSASAVQSIGLTYLMLGEIARIRLVPGDDNCAFTPAVRQVLVLLSRNPSHPWSMSELAAMVGHSVSHLHREFRSQVGVTPMAWLARTRAELAASLLLQSERPVAWVGARVGWADPNYFSRCFRRAHGMSPSSYRERNTATTITNHAGFPPPPPLIEPPWV